MVLRWALFLHEPIDAPRVTATISRASLPHGSSAFTPHRRRGDYSAAVCAGSEATLWQVYKTRTSTIGKVALIVPPLIRQSNMGLLATSLSLLAAFGAFAAPTESTLEKRQIQILSPGAIAAFKPYSFYAASAYCDPSVLKTWTCGGM